MAACRASPPYHDAMQELQEAKSTLLWVPQALPCLARIEARLSLLSIPGPQTPGEAHLCCRHACLVVLAGQPCHGVPPCYSAVRDVCLCIGQPLLAACGCLRRAPLPVLTLAPVPALWRLQLRWGTPLLRRDGRLMCQQLPVHLPALALTRWPLPEGQCALLSHGLCCSLLPQGCLLRVQLLCCGRPI